MSWSGLVLAALVAAVPKGPAKVAVLEVEVGAGVNRQDQASLTDVLVGALTDAEAWQLMTARDLVTLVGLEQKRELLGCSDSDCFVELAGSLGADGVVIVSVGVVSGQIIAAGRVLNPTTAVVLARATVVGSDANLLGTVRRIGQAVRRAYRASRGLKAVGAAIAVQVSSCSSVLDCDAECRAGSPTACTRLGGLLKAGGRPGAAVAAALQRACDLGQIPSCLEAAQAMESVGQLGAAVDPLRRACVAPLEPVAAACGRSGTLLLEGKVVPTDVQQGLMLLRRGCIEGEPLACLDLGRALRPGKAVARDDELYASALELGCSGGLVEGCVALASAHLTGRGAPPDADRAARAAREACRLLGPAGCLERAQRNLSEGDPALAAVLRRALCSSELPEAGQGCTGAARLLRDGPVTHRNLAEAQELASRGCERGDAHACLMVSRGQIDTASVGTDLTGAVRLLERLVSCDEACGEAATAILLRSRGKSPTAVAVATFAESRCQAGSGAACGVAGHARLLGRGVERSDAGAAERFDRGCTLGAAEACAAVAELLESGQGVAPNLGHAHRRRQRACTLGLKAACP